MKICLVMLVLAKQGENSFVRKLFQKVQDLACNCGWYVSALYPQHEVKAGWQQQKGISHLSGLPATF